MISKVKREEYSSLTQEALCNVCFNPLIQAYKERMADQTIDDSSKIKEQFYDELTIGQQSLFSFHVYYDHAIKSLDEFYWWSAYFLAQPKIWSAIKSGLKYFGDDKMLQLLENVETVLKRYNHPSSLEEFNITREDILRDKELLASISPLHNIFNEAAPLTLQIISNYIRDNVKEFLMVED
ncbi:hypothetical protein [Ectobacillus polymachus]|uniref:hypothetical protein n=1 Tax=Ectobacillus polymachus TaxID=1508806 RepID=UPI003A89C9F9